MVNPELDCIFYLAVNDLCALQGRHGGPWLHLMPERGRFAMPARRLGLKIATQTSFTLPSPHPAPQPDRNMRPRKSKCVNHLKHFFSGAARCCATSRQGRGMRQISNTTAIHGAPLQNKCAIPAARAKKSYRPGTIPAIRRSGAARKDTVHRARDAGHISGRAGRGWGRTVSAGLIAMCIRFFMIALCAKMAHREVNRNQHLHIERSGG